MIPSCFTDSDDLGLHLKKIEQCKASLELTETELECQQSARNQAEATQQAEIARHNAKIGSCFRMLNTTSDMYVRIIGLETAPNPELYKIHVVMSTHDGNELAWQVYEHLQSASFFGKDSPLYRTIPLRTYVSACRKAFRQAEVRIKKSGKGL